ncbi:hypothetical protein CT0861_07736 [Colletotrichum tofieldiae]|uniref:Uncharacterized protein n=1 Tax=Colletotrichum tofieldiae TaxID=708197 RepID=A0A166UTR8_9PEZI|nr:hypothetical protein CT0861_07736 [Colletotrichum tofieldiae]
MEEAAAIETRQLRRSTLSHQPGQYEESQAYGVQIPSWVHPTPVFDHSLPRHCSFPSVPLDQPGRADAYVAARERDEADEQKNGFRYNDSDEEHWRAAQSDKDENDDDTMDGSISTEHDIAARGPKHGESFNEYLLSTTSGLDWGSPEPEEGGHPIKWTQIAPSGKWVILLVLCRYSAFASATRILKMTTLDVINFVTFYIQHHRETKQWAKEVNEAPVAIVLQMAREFCLGIDEMGVLKRPYLPTDALFNAERDQAIRYLYQVGQSKLVEDITRWRGHSTDFHTLPIEPEIMAACVMILDEGKESSDVNKVQFPQTEQPSPWLGRVPSECQDLEKCLAELQAYLPRSCPTTANPSESTPKGKPEGLQHSPLIIDYCEMDELYDPQLLPRQRVLSVDMIGYPEFEAQGSCEDIQEQDSMQKPQPLFPELEVPTIRIREASPQAQSDCTISGRISADRMLSPVPFLHSPVRLPGPNLGRDLFLFHRALSVDMGGQGHTADSQLNLSLALNFTNTNAVQEPLFQANSSEASNDLSETMTGQATASFLIALKSTPEKASTPDVSQQQEDTPISSVLTDDDPESPATLSSHKPSRKQKTDDSDGEYQPRPKRPRNPNARKSTSRSKSSTSFQPILPQPDPQPQPTIQPQTGTEGAPQPVKRGRGRPRKNPRPWNLAVQPVQAQLASANDTDTQLRAATSSGTSNGNCQAVIHDLSTGTEAGVQSFTGTPAAAPTSGVRLTSGRTSTRPSPQSSFQTMHSYNTPHATVPESGFPQTRIETSKGEQRHPGPSSYEEFWANHQRFTEAAHQGHRGNRAMHNNAAPLFVPTGLETTSSADAVLHPAYSLMRFDSRQTPQGTTHCDSGTQQQLQSYTDYIFTPEPSNMH